MLLDFDLCYRAVCSRDHRFDGRFFVAVTTTGIYCRPICPAKAARRENLRFFAYAAAAERCHRDPEAQALAMASNTELNLPVEETVVKTNDRYKPGQRRKIGELEWAGLLRLIERRYPGFRD